MDPVILTDPGYLTEHNILLKRLAGGASYDINLTFKDPPGNKVETRFRGVIPARVRNGAGNDKKPPVIYRIRVSPIEKAPFLSTTRGLRDKIKTISDISGQIGELAEGASTEPSEEALEKIKLANANLQETVSKFRL